MAKKKVKKNIKNKSIFILSRYLILLVLIILLPFIYKILWPITVYPAVFLLKLFFSNVSYLQTGNYIVINMKIFIEIIPACIAGSAYLLLLILNLSVPMEIKKRIYSVALGLIMLLLFNIIRISLFSALYYYNSSLFNIGHKITWYFLSTVFIVLIWFLIVKIFSIKEIPVYSDLKDVVREINKK